MELTFGVLYRGDSVFDAPLLSLALIFLLAGGIGVIAECFKRSRALYVSIMSKFYQKVVARATFLIPVLLLLRR